MIDLREIFTSCSRRNTNLKYIKMWQLIKYFLLGWLVSTGAVSCYPAPMVRNLVRWWQIFEVLQLQPQKNVQSDGIYMSGGIAGLLRIRARQCTNTLSLQNGCAFESRDVWFHVHMLLGADTISIFH